VVGWIASRSLSSGARSLDPLARNDEHQTSIYFAALIERSTASLGQQSTFKRADFW